MNECYMAINKETGHYFGGKKNNTHIGYPKINFLKAAMTNAKVNKDNFHFIMLSFDENGIPTLTHID
jgi:hypothetical protein